MPQSPAHRHRNVPSKALDGTHAQSLLEHRFQRSSVKDVQRPGFQVLRAGGADALDDHPSTGSNRR